MDRRLFLAFFGSALATPFQAKALPAPPPVRRLNLVNAHTGETFSGFYRDADGPIATVMDELAVFLRDFHSGEKRPIDPAVLDFLGDVMDGVGQTKATVLSAYRTRETNAMLAKTTFGVADNSQHIYGRALDIALPAKLEEAMETARKMKRGGVGWYPQSHFIHLDSGPVRTWTLDGSNYDHMVVDLKALVAKLRISPEGQLLIGHHRPLTVAQRLALHRVIAKAEFLASHH